MNESINPYDCGVLLTANNRLKISYNTWICCVDSVNM